MADTSTENNGLLVQLLAEVKQLQVGVVDIKCEVGEIKEQLKMMNGRVREHDKDLAVLKDWRTSQVNHTVEEVGDLKVQLAQLAVKYGSLGGIIALMLWVLNQLGVM